MMCGSSDIDAIKVGKVDVTKCNACEFQYIINSKKYLESDWFSEYYVRREKNKYDDLNYLRRKQ